MNVPPHVEPRRDGARLVPVMSISGSVVYVSPSHVIAIETDHGHPGHHISILRLSEPAYVLRVTGLAVDIVAKLNVSE